MLFHNVIPKTCIMSRCRTDLKIRKTRAKRKMRKNEAAGKKCPNLSCLVPLLGSENQPVVLFKKSKLAITRAKRMLLLFFALSVTGVASVK